MPPPLSITTHGAAGEVTGSCYLVESSRARVLVEFGLFQGTAFAERRNRRPPDIRAGKLDAVVLTHAHLDHAGRAPLLPGLGYEGRIHITPASADLARVILADAAAIQEADAARLSRRRERSGRKPEQPLYTGKEVEAVTRRFDLVPYDRAQEIAPGVEMRFKDAGHILGAASLELRIDDKGAQRVIVFSGDVGPRGSPLMRDPQTFDHADLVFLEATYGDRDHRPLKDTIDEFADIVRDAVENKGKVLIPAFAVGRTQQLIYFLGELMRNGRVPRTHIYLDSPMAITATEIHREHRHLFNDDAKRRIENNEPLLAIPELRLVRSASESQKLNNAPGPMIVIAGSGMCEGGRILHHLKHNLWRPTTHVLIVGYQAAGTLGREIVEGAKRVNVMGESIAVRARVHTLGGFSAHAGQSELVDWLRPLAASKPRVAIIHAEPHARNALKARIEQELALNAETPDRGDTITL